MSSINLTGREGAITLRISNENDRIQISVGLNIPEHCNTVIGMPLEDFLDGLGIIAIPESLAQELLSISNIMLKEKDQESKCQDSS